MSLKSWKYVAAVLVVSLAVQPALYAASIPSKTARGQDLAARASDLAFARSAVDRVANALSAQGLIEAQVQARLAALSSSDLVALSQYPAQLKAAGVSMSKKTWTIIGIGAGALVIGGLALKQNDDGEDEDGSDDGED